MLSGCLDDDVSPSTSSAESSPESIQTAPEDDNGTVGEGPSEPETEVTELPDNNVALATQGTVVSSSYSSGNEVFLVDDLDSTDDGFWEPGSNGDYVTLTFDGDIPLQGIHLIHENLEITSTSLDPVTTFNFNISYSQNGALFIPLDLDEYCDELSMSNSGATASTFSCYSSTITSMGKLRVTLPFLDDIKLYEIRAFTY